MRRPLLIAVVAGVVMASASPSRAAESPQPTRQQGAYNIAWASHLAAQDMPSVAQRAIVCLVDAGVNITPDLPADNPGGPVIARVVATELQLSGDADDGQGGAAESAQHGTRMAAFMAAPANAYGTVGAVPWVRVLSVRAMPKGSTSFTSSAFRSGVLDCRTRAGSTPGMAAVSLSLGCECTLSPSEQAALQDAVGSAHSAGMSVVAAAGNASSSTLSSPADVSGVFAVAAGDTTGGGLCSYASWTTQTLVGPGCGVDSATSSGDPVVTDAGGSSSATATTATVIALLRSLKPAASWQQIEAALSSSARTVGASKVLDAEAAARTLGLGDVVDRANAQTPTLTPLQPGSIPGTPTSPTSPGPSQLVSFEDYAAPKVTITRVRGHRLRLVARNRPQGAHLMVKVGKRTISRRSSTVTFTVRRWTELRVRFFSDDGLSSFRRYRNFALQKKSATRRP